MTTARNPYQDWLEAWLRENQGVAGTVHLHQEGELRLVAWVNLPEPVRAAVETVPRGRGMAGLALERDAPVETCNLKEDTTGDVRPGAKAVNAKAAVALPVHDPRGEVIAVAGIAYAHEGEIPPDRMRRLEAGCATAPVS